MEQVFDYRKICHIRYALEKNKQKKSNHIIVCWLLFAIRMVGYLVRSPHTYKKVEDILVVIPSANNKRSIEPILDSMQNKNYTCVERLFSFLPMGKVYFRSIVNASGFLKFYRVSSKEEKQLIRRRFDEFASARELYNVIGEFYDYNPNVKILIVSNDHEPFMRSFIFQAHNHGVKTLYSQHASVSEYFPPLVFDYSFLDGQESYLKYKSIDNIDGKVFLVGSPRFDVITQLPRQISNLIGIAIKRKDDVGKILELINKLKANGYHNIVIRPHPQMMKQNPDLSIYTDIGCKVSNPLEENPFSFNSRLSFLIAGASSIHLEAALMHIPSAIFSFRTNENNLDYYGYAKMGLTPLATSSEEVVMLINNPRLPSVETIRYYDAAFGTEYDGKSASIAGQFVDAFLEGKEEEILDKLFVKSQEGYYKIK